MIKIEKLKSLQYKTVLKEKNNSFSLVIPELALVGEGKSLEDAHRNLTNLKNKYFEQMIELGLEDEIAIPVTQLKIVQDVAFNLRYKIGQYLIIFIFIVSGFFLMKTSMESTFKAAGKAINEKLMAELEKGATPEIKEKRLEKFRNTLKVYSPFIEEFKKTWQGEAEHPTAKKI